MYWVLLITCRYCQSSRTAAYASGEVTLSMMAPYPRLTQCSLDLYDYESLFQMTSWSIHAAIFCTVMLMLIVNVLGLTPQLLGEVTEVSLYNTSTSHTERCVTHNLQNKKLDHFHGQLKIDAKLNHSEWQKISYLQTTMLLWKSVNFRQKIAAVKSQIQTGWEKWDVRHFGEPCTKAH